jgi:hypothetical protein
MLQIEITEDKLDLVRKKNLDTVLKTFTNSCLELMTHSCKCLVYSLVVMFHMGMKLANSFCSSIVVKALCYKPECCGLET